MRNLKKILALVLALMMVVSVMVVASAASFNDYDDVDEIDSDYAEAVEVLTNMGVFRGFDGGFQPDTKVTRAEVATLVYRVLTGDVTDKNVGLYEDYDYFTDVNATNWFAGYVNYAANGKYVVGVGEDRYDPQGNVTGYQLLVIMLRALGYGKNSEFEGTSQWTINAATTAEQLGITDGLKTSLGSELTREEVAYILFNAIQVDKVQYIPAVGYPNAPDETTIGYDVFGLEKVTGVLTANEYADLYGSSPLAAGRTTLTTADGDRTLAISTELTDLGLAKVGYIAGKGAAKTVLALVDGDNTVWETGAKADISNASKFVNTTGLKKGGEQFVNFDSVTTETGEVTTYFRIHYVPVEKGDNKTVTYRVGQTLNEDELTLLENSINALINKENGEDYESVTLVVDEQEVEYNVNAFAYGPNYAIKGVNYQSWEGFVAKYLDVDTIDDNPVNGNENGNWLKVIDNNGDGVADYVFKTVFTMDAIADISDKGVYTMADGTKFDTENKVNPVPVVSSTELAEDDVVVYVVIDGVCYAEVAQVVTETIDTKGIDYKAETITCGDTTYGQSAINIDRADFRDHFLYDTFAFELTNATTGVAYDLYLDFFGYVRAYTENKESFGLGLLTDGYYWTDNKTSDVKVDLVTASEAETTYDVSTAPNTDWSTFVNATGSDIADKGTWGRLYGFVDGFAGAHEFATNVAAYAIGEGSTALYEVGSYTDIFMNTQKGELKLNDKSALTDEKLAAHDGNDLDGNDDDVYATTSTVYYYVTKTAAGDLVVETWVGYANAPKDLTLVAGKDHAYAVYTQTRTSGRDYYYADVVVIEATSAQHVAEFVYLANTRYGEAGFNASSFWMNTIGLDETGALDDNKEIGNLKTGIDADYFPWFYDIEANSEAIAPITDEYAKWGIYASEVVIGRDVYSRDYVYMADGTSFPTETTPVYKVTYDGNRNDWVAYDVVESAATKGDELIYVMNGKDVLYALNVSESTYKDANDKDVYILASLYKSIVDDANYAAYTVTLVNNVDNTTAELNTTPVATTVKGDDGVAQVDVVKGTKLTLTVKEDEGYVDGSYYVEVNSEQVTLDKNGEATVTVDEDTVITVQGANEADEYVIWFAMGDDHKDIKPADVIWNVEKTDAIAAPADKAGYSFEGWYLKEDFSADSKVEKYEDLKVSDFVDGENKDGLKAVKLYAKIEAKEITVNFEFFDGKDGTPIVANTKEETFTYDGKDHYVTLDTQADKAYAVKDEDGNYVFCEDAKLNIGDMTESGTVKVYVFDANQTLTIEGSPADDLKQGETTSEKEWTITAVGNIQTGETSFKIKAVYDNTADNAGDKDLRLTRTITYTLKIGDGVASEEKTVEIPQTSGKNCEITVEVGEQILDSVTMTIKSVTYVDD